MAYKYPEFVINQIVLECINIATKNNTPKKYGVLLFQAAEIIKQLKTTCEEKDKILLELNNTIAHLNGYNNFEEMDTDLDDWDPIK